MTLAHDEQINFAYMALGMVDDETISEHDMETILNFGELLKRYADEDNAIIFDITEYLYEQLRLVRNEHGAYDDKGLRKRLEQEVNNNLNRA